MSSNPGLGFSSRRRACPGPTVKGSIGDRRRPTHPAARRRAATSGEKTLAQARLGSAPMRLRTLIVGLVGLLAIGLVVPLVLMNVGGSHATKGSGNRAGGSPEGISLEWTSLQTSGRPHWGVGHAVGFPP